MPFYKEDPYSIPCPCDECLYPCEGYVLNCEAWKDWALETQDEWRRRKWAELAMPYLALLTDCCPC